jgi:hypothetical protein
MPFFSSDRERRLWTWALVVVLGTYATLGLASTLADVLQARDLFAVAVFILAMAMVGTTILLQGWQARVGGVEIGIGLGIAAVYLLLMLRLTLPERSHLMEYGVLASFIYAALTERRRQGRRVSVPSVFAFLATSLIGVLDEGIQFLLPSRVFELQDIVFNVLAAGRAVITMAILSWVRRRRNFNRY